MKSLEGLRPFFNGLVEKKVFEVYHQEIGRLDKGISDTGDINPLNIAQQQAYGNILQCFREKNVCLLHGVTSSGKTEIYIHLIQEVLKTGKQVLYLLPEIALTTQITERLKGCSDIGWVFIIPSFRTLSGWRYGRNSWERRAMM